MEAAKEKILNIGATAKAGMDKSMATAEEKIERMKTRDQLQKELAEGRKLEKIHQAEIAKQQAYKENAIQKGEAHHIRAGNHTDLGGHHAGVGHHTGLGGHQTAVGHQAGLDEHGGTGMHRIDTPIVDTKTNQTVQETGGGLY